MMDQSVDFRAQAMGDSSFARLPRMFRWCKFSVADIQVVNVLRKATAIQMIEQMRNRVTIIPAAV